MVTHTPRTASLTADSPHSARRPTAALAPARARTFLAAAVLAAALGGVLLAAGSAAAADGEVDPEELEDTVDGVMAGAVGDAVPGATIAVVEGDELVLAKGYGVADVDDGRPVRPDETVFDIGSVAKLVTWTAVMQGVEDGVVDLDTDVNAYLTNSAVEVADAHGEPVTLRHLGTHTGGFDDPGNPGVVADGADVPTLEAALARDQPPRVRAPGETVAYSNYGTALAGHVVAEAYGTTFDELVAGNIFGPLGMDHSTFAQPAPDGHPGDLAAPHQPGADGPATDDPLHITWRPAGAMASTATDMAAFMSAHLGDGALGDARILDPESAGMLRDEHLDRQPDANSVRFGFFEHGPAGVALLEHSGATLHHTAQLVLAPEKGIGVFVAYNVRDEQSGPHEVVDEVLGAYGLTGGASHPEPAPEPEREARAEHVAGEYRAAMLPEGGPARAMTVLMNRNVYADGEGRLASTTPGLGEQQWVETEPYVFEEVDGDAVLAFDVARDGTVAALHPSQEPHTAYEPVPGPERSPVLLTVGGAAVAAFLLSLAGWALMAVRRLAQARRGQPHPDRERRPAATIARASAVGLSLAGGALPILLAASLGAGGEHALVTGPLSLQVAYVLPHILVVLSVATAAGAVYAWRTSAWSSAARVHQAVLAVLGTAFLWPLHVLGLLWA